MENVMTYIIAPIISAFAGWFASAYRNKQKKEADQIEVATQYKKLLTESLEDKRNLYVEIDKLRDELKNVRKEIAILKDERMLMELALSKAARCNKADVCPVISNFQAYTNNDEQRNKEL